MGPKILSVEEKKTFILKALDEGCDSQEIRRRLGMTGEYFARFIETNLPEYVKIIRNTMRYK